MHHEGQTQRRALVVENETGTRTIHDQQQINDLLLARNAKHLSQADGTPFTVEPLTSLLGRFGTNNNSTKLLDGELNIDEIRTTDATKTILRKLKRVEQAGHVPSHISPEDIRTGYKTWRESTSTSPSGLHLGHDKALFRFESKGNPDDPKKMLSNRVFAIKANLINLAVQYGHVYKRWTTVVNAMIEKSLEDR